MALSKTQKYKLILTAIDNAYSGQDQVELLEFMADVMKSDREYQVELSAKPTLGLFLEENSKHQYAMFYFSIGDKAIETSGVSDFTSLYNPKLLDQYIVIGFEKRVVSEGHYVNEAEWSYDTTEYKLTLDKADKYAHVRRIENK